MAENLTFLALPPEIRNQIYEILLSSSIAPPKSPSASGPRSRLDSLGLGGNLASTTYYPIQPFPWPGAALIRTCHQICTEVTRLAPVVANRIRAQKNVNYELDIMIDEEYAIYLTWVNLTTWVDLFSASPTEQRSVNEMWVNLRTVGVLDPYTRRGGRWTDANARPPSLVWDLYDILARFFKYGPLFQTSYLNNRIMATNVPSLEALVLNVVTPTEEEMEGRRYAETWNEESVGVLHPEKLVELLEVFIDYAQSPYSQAGINARRDGMFEKIETIQLCLDGEEVRPWGFG